MSCCCRSEADNKSMKTMYSGNAPERESMNRDSAGSLAGKMDDSDTKAVDWWRHHPHGNGSAGVMSKSDLDKMLQPHLNDENGSTQRPQQPSLSTSTFEQRSQGRMQDRNPLQKPYDMQRELPIRPVDGNVLLPQLLPTTTVPNNREASSSVPHRTDGSSGLVEVFEPEVDRSSSQQPMDTPSIRRLSEFAADPHDGERMAVISKVDSTDQESRQPVDPPGTPSRTSSLRYSRTTPNNINNESDDSNKRKKLPLSKFIEKKSKRALSTTKEDSDHLSDVPSDVDSVTKERYLLACQMLKTTIIQKETALIPIEKEFILSLLGDFDHGGGDSVVSDEQVSAIERATLRLESDPIFQEPVLAKNNFLHSPVASARLSPPRSPSRKQVNDGSSREETLTERSDKNPHTATRKPRSTFIKHMTNPCNPKSSTGARGEVSHDIHIVEESQVGYGEWNEPELNDGNKNELVRFDGWSFQRSVEYPFLILDAYGDNLNPRVMTPAILEALRGFMPYRVSESNFWLKYSLVRDGASLASLLSTIRGSTYTMIGVETNRGEVFGSFTGTPWRMRGKWFGNGEAFLWRLKKPRYASPANTMNPNFEREMEVYPYTGYDEMVQYCTAKTIAVGGGDWLDIPCPFDDDNKGIGFMIDGDLAGGETNCCATFANPRLAKQTTASSEFTITNLEVWTLTPCMNVKDAVRMEMQKLFLEEQGFSMMRG